MDKSWMTKPRYSDDYLNGLERFLDFAFSDPSIGTKILCPCVKCSNRLWKTRDEVKDHVVCKGMTKGYILWVCHGEKIITRDASPPIFSIPPPDSPLEENYDMHELMRDAFGIHDVPLAMDEDDEEEVSNENVNTPNVEPHIDTQDGLHEEAPEFLKFAQEGNQELYPGSKSTKLSFTIQLMHIKSYNSWSGKSVDMLLKFLKQQFPDANFPKTLYEAKRMRNALGLGYEKIDACPNNCMLYRRDRATQQSCHICHASRWQQDTSDSGRAPIKKAPCKVLRYFPLIPRLQRLYMSSKTSSLMIWHEKGRTKDGLLRHPADSSSWNDFNQRHPDFARDPRNVVLAFSTDGFNPHGSMNNSYSIWPVILIPYNLPPWMCMKQSSLILSTIIPGKKAPGQEIDIFLQPLIDELLQLWEGVQTYDATSGQYFIMRAALLWTISDFPAYGYLSGWSTSGKKACPSCADLTESRWLSNGGKYCYLGHRRWLSESHAFRAQKRDFDGTEEWRTGPKTLSGSDALRQLQGIGFIEESIISTRNKTSTSKRKKKRVMTHEENFDKEDNSTPWKKKSIFFKLPYWEFNILRHNLDVMHIEKNVCENVLGTLLNIDGKSKDNANARHDLVDMNVKHDLHPIMLPTGKMAYPPAKYAMDKKEKEIFLDVLEKIEVPDGYASQISRGISVTNRKIQILKTHDYHILMQDLLPIALRSSMRKEVTKQIIELSNIFKGVCCKTLSVAELDRLKSRAILVLCHMEKMFPPSFFTIMVHLVIHLADEAKVGGPVQFRWMYPIERCWKVFKKYVGNKAHPEGSIAEGYLAEECNTFCSRYFDEIETVFNRPRRNTDLDPRERDKYLLSSGGIFMGAAETKPFDQLPLLQAHRYILLHLDEIQPYVEEFKRYKIQTSLHKRYITNPSTLQRIVTEEFPAWFKTHVSIIGYENVPERIRWLSMGPSQVVQAYKGFIFNGIRFRTIEGNKGKKSQNYGVVVTSMTPSVASSRDPNLIDGQVEYFGVLTEINELNYSGRFKVVLFRCDWADTTKERGVKKDEYGFTLVNFKRLSHTGKHIAHDPFVLPSQVQQVFYVEDPLSSPWWVAIKTTPRDLFDLGVNDESSVEENDDENNENSFARSVLYERQELEECD